MEPAIESPAVAQPIRVLVVDDSRVIRHMVVATLRKNGWEVQEAEGGPQALAMLVGWRPDVVVCDLNMPEMDGTEVVSRLATLDQTLPVVMFSDEGELARVLGTVHCGAFDFIRKDKDLRALAGAIERAARHGRLVQDNLRLAGELQQLNEVLEGRVEERGKALDVSLAQLTLAQAQLLRSEKFSALGQLAAGVAHEINTPVQYVGDSVAFLKDAFAGLELILAAYRSRSLAITAADPAAAQALADVERDGDLAFVLEQAPLALERSREGVARVAAIVRAMKEFSHPGRSSMETVDVNDVIRRTATMAANEIKQVAELELKLGDLPEITCNAGEIGQVILNILINATHAVADRVSGTAARGRIEIATRREQENVVIAIGDTGGGIPLEVRDRIFDPFFTTKEVGRGSGIGLALARSVIVEKHGGQLSFETEVGRGTTFFITLPIRAEPNGAATVTSAR
jgi:signal transduction histidine kinase